MTFPQLVATISHEPSGLFKVTMTRNGKFAGSTMHPSRETAVAYAIEKNAKVEHKVRTF